MNFQTTSLGLNLFDIKSISSKVKLNNFDFIFLVQNIVKVCSTDLQLIQGIKVIVPVTTPAI